MLDDELVFLPRMVRLFTKPVNVPFDTSLLGGRRRLETYGSLVTISDEMGTSANYPGLFVINEFSDVFS